MVRGEHVAMSKTTVCFVHDDALDLFRGHNGARFGGAETQVFLLANLLARDPEFGVQIVGQRDASDIAHDGIEFRSQKPPIQHGVPVLSRFINQARLQSPFQGLNDGILIQTIAGGSTIQSSKLARRIGLKFVYRMSCDADVDGSLVSTVIRSQYLSALQDADGVIAQTQLQQTRLRSELGVESTVIPNIVVVPEKPVSLRGSSVLWVGRAAPIKRPWIFVETARAMPQHRFVMVMPKEDPLFWMSVVREAESVPNLTLIPGLPYFDMDAQYQDATLLVSTSLMEGFPNVFLQAAAQSTPIISLDVDPGGMLEAQGCGRCAEGDIERFRALIADTLSDPETLGRMGEAAHAYVAATHSQEAVTPILTEFLRTVASK